MKKFKSKTKSFNILCLLKLLPFFSFVVTFVVLYLFDPKMFETTWKGRTYYLFFLWLLFLETILQWEALKPTVYKFKSIKIIVFTATLLLPPIYIIWANCLGLNELFVELAGKAGVPFAAWMPIANEYLILMIIFAAIITLEYGVTQLRNYSISLLFLGTVGLIFLVDNLYPYGQFTPFQLIVPTTTGFAANVLSFMGYKTEMRLIANHPTFHSSIPYLKIENQQGKVIGFYIGWPCSGVESLLIYSITISLFLKRNAMPKVQKIIYFAIGAIITYCINIVRIVAIFIIAINNGDWRSFHDYYGQLFSVLWIISYPLIIIGSQLLLNKIGKSINSLKMLKKFYSYSP